MDSSSVVSSLNASLELHKPPTMVQNKNTCNKWSDTGSRRQSYDICQRSEVSTGTDFSAERPSTRDTNTFLMRDASILSSQPDKSNFREKMQHWDTYYEETSPSLVAPRPTTSFSVQKSTNRAAVMEDIEREMSFLMSRPSTSFPSKPKELIEPLEGLLPDERPVSQKKFFVLPSIGNRDGEFILRRQRSNIETTNQLDYSRHRLENDINFFSDYYSNKFDHDLDSASDYDARNSPTKGKTGTPMPLPPILKLKWEKRRHSHNLAGLQEEYSRDHSEILSDSSAVDDSDDDNNKDDRFNEYDYDGDSDCLRVKTPYSLHSSLSNRTINIPPPAAFRWSRKVNFFYRNSYFNSDQEDEKACHKN